MSNTIYTATGCARCKITKRYMRERGIDFEEFDFKGEGKEAFAKFYRSNRKDIFRDNDGVEFPVFTDGKQIRQGVSVVIGYLLAGNRLDGYINRSLLHGAWIDGLDISGGDPASADDLVQVLSYLKQNGLKLQLTSNGKNADVLAKLLAQGLGDRLIMDVKGPLTLYGELSGEIISQDDIRRSISLAPRFAQYEFYTTVAPLMRSDGDVSFLSPEEIGETAKLIEDAVSSKKNPYTLRMFDPKSATDEKFKDVEPLPSSAMFKYRTKARRHQVLTEIEK